MKLIIAGSRSISDYEIVRQAVIASGYWAKFKRDLEIVCGMALSWEWDKDPVSGGVDRWGYEFAKRNGLKIHEFPANWSKYGKSAGYIRNREMGDFSKAHNGALLLVWDGISPGSLGMYQYAQEIDLERVMFQRVTDELYRRVEE